MQRGTADGGGQTIFLISWLCSLVVTDRLVVYLYSIEHNVDDRMRAGFVYLDEVGRPSVSTTGEVATEEQCALFLRTIGFGEGRGEAMLGPAGVTTDMQPCEATRRLCIYATEPEASIPVAPLPLAMVRPPSVTNICLRRPLRKSP